MSFLVPSGPFGVARHSRADRPGSTSHLLSDTARRRLSSSCGIPQSAARATTTKGSRGPAYRRSNPCARECPARLSAGPYGYAREWAVRGARSDVERGRVQPRVGVIRCRKHVVDAGARESRLHGGGDSATEQLANPRRWVGPTRPRKRKRTPSSRSGSRRRPVPSGRSSRSNTSRPRPTRIVWSWKEQPIRRSC